MAFKMRSPFRQNEQPLYTVEGNNRVYKNGVRINLPKEDKQYQAWKLKQANNSITVKPKKP